jgi:hypothetical protein
MLSTSFPSRISSSSVIQSTKLLNERKTNKIFMLKKYLATIFLAVNLSININNDSMMKYSLIMDHVLSTVSLRKSLTLKFCQ